MAAEDMKAALLRVPWIARLVDHPDVEYLVPNSRAPKASGEDSLFAESLQTARTLSSCLCFYRAPPPEHDNNSNATVAAVDEVVVAAAVGDGLNGWPAILHGGISATLIDECMGIFQSVNALRAHRAKVRAGTATGDAPLRDVDSFTGELTLRYLRPVKTPGHLVVVVRRRKREGRKAWFVAELKQCHAERGSADGELVTCVTGEGLFIDSKPSKL